MAGSISQIAGVTPSEKPSEPEKTAEPEEKAAPEAPEAPKTDDFLNLLMSKITPIGDESSVRPIKMMIYSAPGVGKTTLMGQIPGNLIIDSEKGRITLDEIRKKQPDLLAKDAQILAYKSFEGLDRTIDTLHANPPELDWVKTVTIDTLNNIQKRELAAVVEREWRRNPISVNRYVPETEHHTEVNEQIRRLAQKMVDLERNVIFVAHSKTVEPKGKPSKTYPDFSEKLANTIAAMVDVVGYMYVAELDGELHRVIKFHPSEGVTAKTRLKELPDNMVDPTWEKIWAAHVS